MASPAHPRHTARAHILYEDSRGPTPGFALHKFVLANVQDVLCDLEVSISPFELERRLVANPKNSDGKVLTALRDDSDRLHAGRSIVVAWLDDDRLHRALSGRVAAAISAASPGREKIKAVRSLAPENLQAVPGALKVFLVEGNTERLIDRLDAAQPGMFPREELEGARDKELTARDLCFVRAGRLAHAGWRAELRRRDVPFDCMMRFLARVAVLEPWPPWATVTQGK